MTAGGPMATEERVGGERFLMHRFSMDRLYFAAQANCRCYDGRGTATRRNHCVAEQRALDLEAIVSDGMIVDFLEVKRVGSAIQAGMAAWRTNPASPNPYKARGWTADLHWWWQVGRAWAEWTESAEAVVRALGGEETDLDNRYWQYRQWLEARRQAHRGCHDAVMP